MPVMFEPAGNPDGGGPKDKTALHGKQTSRQSGRTRRNTTRPRAPDRSASHSIPPRHRLRKFKAAWVEKWHFPLVVQHKTAPTRLAAVHIFVTCSRLINYLQGISAFNIVRRIFIRLAALQRGNTVLQRFHLRLRAAREFGHGVELLALH